DVRIGVGCCLQSVAVMGFYDRFDFFHCDDSLFSMVLEKSGLLGNGNFPANLADQRALNLHVSRSFWATCTFFNQK
ncbi:MAG: hypothetical protein AAF386_12490, partial [Pseudomonadota bacterium]